MVNAPKPPNVRVNGRFMPRLSTDVLSCWKADLSHSIAVKDRTPPLATRSLIRRAHTLTAGSDS
jgi:hypothetical protein